LNIAIVHFPIHTEFLDAELPHRPLHLAHGHGLEHPVPAALQKVLPAEVLARGVQFPRQGAPAGSGSGVPHVRRVTSWLETGDSIAFPRCPGEQ